jgi:L-ascorbate metabolism protein UlaG (beta-lactamase superfamily)
MLESAAGRIYIDALFGDGLPEYSVVPAPNRDSLERALGGYGGPAVVLTTHAHRDHFDSAAVGRYLGSNPDAVALGPPGTPQRRDSTSLDLDWVKVRPVAVPHGPTRRPIGHTGYLVTLGGTTALHVGDTTSEPGTWPALGLPHEGVDIALVPYWYAFDDERFRELLNVVGRARVVLLHAPLPAAESEDLKGRGGWSAVSRSLRERHARVRTPSASGEVVEP